MTVGRAGGIDRNPRLEQLAERSTSLQAHTSGGHSMGLLPTSASTSDSPLAEASFPKDQSISMKNKTNLNGASPGLALFMALRLDFQSLTFGYFTFSGFFHFCSIRTQTVLFLVVLAIPGEGIGSFRLLWLLLYVGSRSFRSCRSF